MNSLKFNADTLERLPMCGLEEHVHDETCPVEDGVYLCGFEEHVHTDACFQQRPAVGDASEVSEIEADLVTEDAPEPVVEDEVIVDEAPVDAPVEEVWDVDLDDAGGEEAPEGLEATEYEPVPAEAPREPYYFRLAEPMLLSDIVPELSVRMEDIIEVAAVVEAEAEDSPIGIEALEGDWLLYAARDFELAELAVVTVDDIIVLNLFDGMAVVVEEEPVTEEEEGPAVEETEPVVEEEEAPADEEAEPVVEEEETPADEEAEPVDEEDETAAEEEQPSDVDEEGAIIEEETVTEEPNTEDEAPVADEVSDGLRVEYDLAGFDGYPLSLRALLGDAIFAPVEEAEPEEAPEIEEEAEAPAEEASETEAPEEVVEEQEVQEVAAELEEAPAALLPIEYDEALLSVEIAADDYLLTALSPFDETTVWVGPHAVALKNGLAPSYPAQSFAASTEYVDVTVTADAGAFPEGTTMAVADVEDEDTLTGIADTVTEGFVEVQRVHAVDISFYGPDGAELEPLLPISVVMTVRELEQDEDAVVVHLTDEGEAEVVETDPVETSSIEAEETAESEPVVEEASLAFEADAFSVYAVVVTKKLETRVLASDGATYRIEVTYGPGAGVPDTAALQVAEVTDDAQYLDQVAATLPGNKRVTLARFFDIKIMDGEEEVHPLEAVEVRVTLYDDTDQTDPDPLEAQIEAAPEVLTAEAVDAPVEETVLEIAEESAETGDEAPTEGLEAEAVLRLEATNEDDHIVTLGEPVACAAHFGDDVSLQAAKEREEVVTFMAESFSVWGVVYTVDFYYGNYEWHIDGGSYIGLRALVEKLNIAEDAQAFVDQVADVVFSAPELIAVSRVNEDTTVGAVKAALGLDDIVYSSGLTEEKVEEIDATEIKAFDWALISIRAFDTEESLIISMQDGSRYEIRVEDAQYKMVLHGNLRDSGKWFITI